ncbi:hypothetical protein H650_16650 [Enterobacter sp. R4-368]|nr:hypothetical protein H650_16650 [Enterobacter sp. R4-368]
MPFLFAKITSQHNKTITSFLSNSYFHFNLKMEIVFDFGKIISQD